MTEQEHKAVWKAIREAAEVTHNDCAEQEGINFLSRIQLDEIADQAKSNLNAALDLAEARAARKAKP